MYHVVGATVSRSSLHLLPHRDKKTKQAEVVTKEEEVASKEKNPEEKVAQEENAETKTSRGGAICDPIEKGSNSGNIIKTQRQMPHYSVDIQKLDIYTGCFFDCSAQKTTKYKEKLKYQNCSANCSSQKILSTRKKQSIRTETTAHVYSCISNSRVSKHFLQ